MSLFPSLSFTLGATLTKEHATSVGRVQTDLVALRGEAKKLGQTAKEADRFGKTLDSFQKAGVSVADAEGRLAALRVEAEKNPSDKLAAKIAKATRALEQAKDKAAESKDRLGQLGKSLRDAGVDTGKLESEQRRLGKSLEATRSQMDKLNAVTARRQQVREAFGEAAARTGVAVGAAASFGATFGKPVNAAAAFQDQVRQIAITGEFAGTEQEAQLGRVIRDTGLRFNQRTDDLTAGLTTLVAQGFDATKLDTVAPTLARFATATRTSFDDIGAMTSTLVNVLNVEDLDLALNQAAKAGKLGAFEVKDMARWFPALGGLIKSLGVTGNEAVVNLASRLQIARLTAGSNDEAANNLKNFLAKITSQDTFKAFDKLGIDFEQRLKSAAVRGIDPVATAVDSVLDVLARKSPEATQALRKLADETAAVKDPAQRAALIESRQGSIQSLTEKIGIGEVFRDQQAVSFLIAELQNRDALKDITAKTRTGKTAGGQAVIDADFAAQEELITNRTKRASGAISELGKVIGESLTPVVGPLIDGFAAVVTGLAKLGTTFPKTATVIVTAAAAIGGAFVLGKFFLAARSVIGLLRAVRALGAAQRVAAGGGLLSRALGAITPIASRLGTALGGKLVKGGMAAGRAILFVGRALLLNPIGIAVTVIAGAAFLIWKNWSKIGPALKGFWGGVKNAASNAWGGIKSVAGTVFEASKKAFSFTPLGLVVKNWGAIKGFFSGFWTDIKTAFSGGIGGVFDLFLNIGEKFVGIGAQIMDGLLGGITAGWDKLKAGVTNIGDGIANQFKSVLGIKSPSRVFMGLGDMLGLGLQQGMLGTARAVAGAALTLATAATPLFPGSDGPGIGAQSAQAAGTAAVAAAAAGTQQSAPASTPASTQSATTQITIGPIQITQKSGEDAEALAERVAAAIERKAGRIRRSALGDLA